MKKILYVFMFVLFSMNAKAIDIKAENLKLSEEQNAQLLIIKEKLQAEVNPVWEEIESAKVRIVEIEKKYFEEFWKILTDEQKKEFAKFNAQ